MARLFKSLEMILVRAGRRRGAELPCKAAPFGHWACIAPARCTRQRRGHVARACAGPAHHARAAQQPWRRRGRRPPAARPLSRLLSSSRCPQDAPPDPELNTILTLLSSIFQAESSLIGAARGQEGRREAPAPRARACAPSARLGAPPAPRDSTGRRAHLLPRPRGRASGPAPPHRTAPHPTPPHLTAPHRAPPHCAALFGDRLIWIKQAQGGFKVTRARAPPSVARGSAGGRCAWRRCAARRACLRWALPARRVAPPRNTFPPCALASRRRGRSHGTTRSAGELMARGGRRWGRGSLHPWVKCTPLAWAGCVAPPAPQPCAPTCHAFQRRATPRRAAPPRHASAPARASSDAAPRTPAHAAARPLPALQVDPHHAAAAAAHNPKRARRRALRQPPIRQIRRPRLLRRHALTSIQRPPPRHAVGSSPGAGLGRAGPGC
jgi:hypothetical protein